MFVIKQLATAASAFVLAFGATAILWPAPASAASPTISRSIWVGEAWADSASPSRLPVRLYIKSVDPFDLSVKAEEGQEQCDGELRRELSPPVERPVLRCGRMTILDGMIAVANGKLTYSGHYVSGTSKGQFSFTFGRNN